MFGHMAAFCLKFGGVALVLTVFAVRAFADDPYRGPGHGPESGAPEIDPASIGSALTLLVGGLLTLIHGTGRA